MKKKYVLITSALVFVFAFSLVLTLDTSAAKKCEPRYCCTYTTSCGTTGWGSWLTTTCYDEMGKPYSCTICTSRNNPCCIMRPAAACVYD